MQPFNNFGELADNGQFTENAPGVGDRYNRPDIPPVEPPNGVPSQLPPPDPQWRKTVDDRLGSLERNMGSMRKEMTDGFTEIKRMLGK